MGRHKHRGHVRTRAHTQSIDPTVIEHRLRIETIREIQTALKHPDGPNLRMLRRIAVSKGFMNDSIRGEIWPVMLGIPSKDAASMPLPSLLETKHDAMDQVALDINRSLWEVPDDQRAAKRQQLSDIVNATIAANPGTNYVQGLHDVAAVLLLTIGPARATAVLHGLVNTYLRDSLQDLNHVMTALELLWPLLDELDPDVANALRQCDVQWMFPVPWLLTWFSHSLPTNTSARLFDYLCSSHPLAAVYVTAAIIIQQREELLAVPKEDRDYSIVHSRFQRLPKDLNAQTLIRSAHAFMAIIPPQILIDMTKTLVPNKHIYATYPFTDVLPALPQQSGWDSDGNGNASAKRQRKRTKRISKAFQIYAGITLVGSVLWSLGPEVTDPMWAVVSSML